MKPTDLKVPHVVGSVDQIYSIAHGRLPKISLVRRGSLSVQDIDAKLLSYWQSDPTINQLPQPIWNRSNRTSLNGWLEGPSLTERRTRRSSGE